MTAITSSVRNAIMNARNASELGKVMMTAGALKDPEKRELHLLISTKSSQLFVGGQASVPDIKAAMHIAHTKLSTTCRDNAKLVVDDLKGVDKKIGEMMGAFFEGLDQSRVASWKLEPNGKFTLELTEPLKKLVLHEDYPTGLVMMLGDNKNNTVTGTIKSGKISFSKGFEAYLKIEIPEKFKNDPDKQGKIKKAKMAGLLGKIKTCQVSEISIDGNNASVTVKIPLSPGIFHSDDSTAPVESLKQLWTEGIVADDHEAFVK